MSQSNLQAPIAQIVFNSNVIFISISFLYIKHFLLQKWVSLFRYNVSLDKFSVLCSVETRTNCSEGIYFSMNPTHQLCKNKTGSEPSMLQNGEIRTMLPSSQIEQQYCRGKIIQQIFKQENLRIWKSDLKSMWWKRSTGGKGSGSVCKDFAWSSFCSVLFLFFQQQNNRSVLSKNSASQPWFVCKMYFVSLLLTFSPFPKQADNFW